MKIQVPAYASGLDGVQAREKSGVDCELKKTMDMLLMPVDWVWVDDSSFICIVTVEAIDETV